MKTLQIYNDDNYSILSEIQNELETKDDLIQKLEEEIEELKNKNIELRDEVIELNDKINN